MKIKRIISIIAVILVISILSACGKPSGMSQDTYDTGLQALEIIEQYNDGKLSDDTAKDRIDRLLDHLETDGEHHAEMVKLIMQGFLIHISSGGDTYADEKELKEQLGK